MAKKKVTDNGTPSDNQGESISGYFRKVFAANPQWLDSRSNDAVLAQWLADHPGETEVPGKVKQNLSNIKSVLRKKGRKKRGRPKKESLPVQSAPVSTETPRKPIKGLDALEEQIDDCLSYAKHLDREGLADVINLLRRARNGVVWKMGEKLGV
jgi:hypothetical protein